MVIGGVNNKQSRIITLDFSFLPAGDYQMEWVCDAKDADVNPENYIKEIIKRLSLSQKSFSYPYHFF